MMGRYIDANKFDIGTSNSNTIDLFSNKFCFQVLSRLLQHIDEGCYSNSLFFIYEIRMKNQYNK